MKTPLAWKNLVYNKVRTAIGVAGVGFAVVLIFMQLGFLGGITKTATQIYDALDFDLMLRSPTYLHLTEARSFSRFRVHQAASLPEVTHARSFYLGLTEWQAPSFDEISIDDAAQDREGQWRGIIAMGTEPEDPAFTREDINSGAKQLTDSRYVLVDVRSTPDYGPRNGKRFSETDIGTETALGPNLVEIIGLFKLGAGMASNGACLVNTEGYVRACPWQTIDDVTFGLIKLREGSDPEAVRRQLENIYGIPAGSSDELAKTADPADLTNRNVEVLTRAEVNAREEYRWVHETPLGQIFTLGVWVAVFVGVAIVYQVLSTDIANMMSEYATLKAMGYSSWYLTSVVLTQAVLLALVGYVPSFVISYGLYHLIESLSGMPMIMTPGIMLLVLVVAVMMCVISGTFALRKLHNADPADLF